MAENATNILQMGMLRARLARGVGDLAASRALRARYFPVDRTDDPFDLSCRHVLLEDVGSAALLGSFRILCLDNADGIERAYSARYYDLSALKVFPAPVMEVGRVCLDSTQHNPDLLRLAWGAITRLVDADNIGLLFGCASFPGTNPVEYAEAFAHLGARHQAPVRWQPGRRTQMAVPLATRHPTARPRLSNLPPLLRTYLGMGGWVSDHAVIDRDMGTMHVFTGVEITAIPPVRARLLRAIAGAAAAP